VKGASETSENKRRDQGLGACFCLTRRNTFSPRKEAKAKRGGSKYSRAFQTFFLLELHNLHHQPFLRPPHFGGCRFLIEGTKYSRRPRRITIGHIKALVVELGLPLGLENQLRRRYVLRKNTLHIALFMTKQQLAPVILDRFVLNFFADNALRLRASF